MESRVQIEPRVLAAIVELTALATPGIAPQHRQRRLAILRGGGPAAGVEVTTGDDGVLAAVAIVVEPGTNLHDVGRAVQRGVARALHDMAGLAVREVNVFIQDIEGTA